MVKKDDLSELVESVGTVLKHSTDLPEPVDLVKVTVLVVTFDGDVGLGRVPIRR